MHRADGVIVKLRRQKLEDHAACVAVDKLEAQALGDGGGLGNAAAHDRAQEVDTGLTASLGGYFARVTPLKGTGAVHGLSDLMRAPYYVRDAFFSKRGLAISAAPPSAIAPSAGAGEAAGSGCASLW